MCTRAHAHTSMHTRARTCTPFCRPAASSWQIRSRSGAWKDTPSEAQACHLLSSEDREGELGEIVCPVYQVPGGSGHPCGREGQESRQGSLEAQRVVKSEDPPGEPGDPPTSIPSLARCQVALSAVTAVSHSSGPSRDPRPHGAYLPLGEGGAQRGRTGLLGELRRNTTGRGTGCGGQGPRGWQGLRGLPGKRLEAQTV